MQVYSISEEDSSRRCLISLYPLIRESDGKHFYGVLHTSEEMWLVIDKLSFRVIETVKDDCGDIYDRSTDCDGEEDLIAVKDSSGIQITYPKKTKNNRSEDGFVYVTDTTQDFMKYSESQLSLSTIQNKIVEVVEAYNPDVYSTASDDSFLAEEYAITDGREDVKAELYRYENYVMRHFKSRYFDKIVEVTDGKTEWKYLKVNDITVDYERCPISPVLMFSGERISLQTKSADADVFLGLTYDKLKQDKWVAVGLLDEIMLKYGRKTSSFFSVRIIDDTSVIEDVLRKTANDQIKKVLTSCSFTE